MKNSRRSLLALHSTREGLRLPSRPSVRPFRATAALFHSVLARLALPRLTWGKRLTHRERARARHVRVRPRSPLVRAVAGLAILSSFSLLWRPAFAGPTPAASSALPGPFDAGAAPLTVDRGPGGAEPSPDEEARRVGS